MKRNNYEDSHPAKTQLLLALDGELGPGEAASVSQHVESCPVCRAHWEKWQQLSERIVEYHAGALQARVAKMGAPIPRVELSSRRSPGLARVMAAFSAVAAAMFCLAWLFARGDRPATVPRHPTVPAAVVAAAAPALPEPQAVRRRRMHRRSDSNIAADNAGFVALPFSDAALPIGDATVVRVELPVEELWLSGLAVSGEYKATMVQADVLLGMDGLPRGIRLVQ